MPTAVSVCAEWGRGDGNCNKTDTSIHSDPQTRSARGETMYPQPCGLCGGALCVFVG